jgi:hypothetical protein
MLKRVVALILCLALPSICRAEEDRFLLKPPSKPSAEVERAHRLELIGLALTLCGAATTTVGLSVAVTNIVTDNTDPKVWGPGFAAVGVGLASSIVGTALMIAGGVKERRSKGPSFAVGPGAIVGRF